MGTIPPVVPIQPLYGLSWIGWVWLGMEVLGLKALI